jgi:hypothetical protein
MNSKQPTQQIGLKKRALLLAIVIAGLLAIGLISREFPGTSGSIFPTPTLQINLPSVEYPTIPPSAPEFVVPLQSLGDSGITGTVTFKDVAGTVAILIHLDGVGGDEESEEALTPAELHFGTCTAPGDLAYPMSPPDAGASETDLDINLKQFHTQKPMAVILYRSLQDHTPIACADVQ